LAEFFVPIGTNENRPPVHWWTVLKNLVGNAKCEILRQPPGSGYFIFILLLNGNGNPMLDTKPHISGFDRLAGVNMAIRYDW